MSGFSRGFERLDEFCNALSDARDTRWHDLVSYCRPAGTSSGYDGLRLVVHDDILHFYRQGQRVAEVAYSGTRFTWKAHREYVVNLGSVSRDYPNIVAATETPRPDKDVQYRPGGVEHVIARAGSHVGPEKSFVDDLVAHNANIIDLEMGWSRGEQQQQMIDLVNLEVRDRSAKVVLWEAKVSTNDELTHPDARKPKAEDEPPYKYIFDQIDAYRKRLETTGNRAAVINAYIQSCKTLTGIHRAAGSDQSLSKDIRDIADGKITDIEVDTAPRAVVLKIKNHRDGAWSEKLNRLREKGVVVKVCHPGDLGSFDLLRESE